MEQERSSALLVRVWTEGSAGAFRARVAAVDTSGATGEEVTLAVVASPGDVVDAVRTWLDRFLERDV